MRPNRKVRVLFLSTMLASQISPSPLAGSSPTILQFPTEAIRAARSLRNMTTQLLQEAAQVIPNQQLLINVVSKRVRQLGLGHRPLVEATPRSSLTDIALKEIIAGKLTYEELERTAADSASAVIRAARAPVRADCPCRPSRFSIAKRSAIFTSSSATKPGIELKGSEVKSIRAGKANIGDAFARIEKGEAFLYNADIQPYERASHEVPAAKRVRKLLLHRARDRQTLWPDEHRGPRRSSF